MNLLTTENAKTVKGIKKGFQTYILYLAPGKVSGYQVCPMADVCLELCLYTAGRGKMNHVQEARIRKTKFFFEYREEFMRMLVEDVKKAIKSSSRKNLTPVFRLNGTSDIRWELHPVTCPDTGMSYPNIMKMFPTVQFYDYTKLPNRRNIPENYHLTFSRSQSNNDHVIKAIQNNMNIAVVFDSLPETYMGRPVFNGDDTDLRFMDPSSIIVGLKAKGKARKDTSGFVVKI